MLRIGACVVMIGRVLVLPKAGSCKPSPLHMRSRAVALSSAAQVCPDAANGPELYPGTDYCRYVGS